LHTQLAAEKNPRSATTAKRGFIVYDLIGLT
jgi:hypothetical protein